MHIIQLAYLKGGTIPRIGYGGIERMVHTLSRELVRQGHTVTLMAPSGSTFAEGNCIEASNYVEAYNILQTLSADVIHDHNCWQPESPVRQGGLRIPFLSTSHVNHAIGWTRNVVYLSQSQRTQHGIQVERNLNFSPVIYVPIDPQLQPLGLPRQDYLLYLGSVAEYKGVLEAAEVAQYLGRKLVVAGPAWGDYADKVKAHPSVEYVGEVADPYRSQLLEQTYAVMCLHNNHGGWQEPGCGVFGEAMAFGTPVAALPNGCLPELVVNGYNGWIAETTPSVGYAMYNFTRREQSFPPLSLAAARQNYSAENIVKQYVNLYQSVIEGATWG